MSSASRDPKIIAMDEYRPHVLIGCDNGNQHIFAQAHLEAIADGKAPVTDLPDEVVQSIVGQWLHFVDYISEFSEES